MSDTGFPPKVVVAFDRVIEKHTTRMFEDLDDLAQEHDLDSAAMQSLFAERCGDLGDVFAEWIAEGWE